MKRQELTASLREYVRTNLSPTNTEQKLVTKLYVAFQSVLGSGCYLIGSYARFTASRPIHDLDILFVAGKFNPKSLNPQPILADLQEAIRARLKNPTTYQVKISLQTHSVTILFLDGQLEKVAVDIVPAFTSTEVNEFGESTYWVPEILKMGHRNRRALYEELTKTTRSEVEWWIKSDPRGYIQSATNLNAKNGDFRKTAKFVKRWKHNCKEKDEVFGLKSFHIEQAIYRLFEQEPSIDIAGAIFRFFCELPQSIASPQIRDRADRSRFIDEYLNDLTDAQKKQIIKARDAFLIKLEYLAESPNVAELLMSGFHERASSYKGVRTEEYLFDSKFPTFIEASNVLRIKARALQGVGGFREKILNAIGLIERERKIEFRKEWEGAEVDWFMWKVKNDNRSREPRGEITNGSTRNDPENTRYRGSHYVECYAIKDRVCIARARQNVVLGNDGE